MLMKLRVILYWAGSLGTLFIIQWVFPPAAHNRENPNNSSQQEQILPTTFLTYSSEEPSYGILVEKQSQKLYLYKINGKVSLIKTYFCSTGQRDGNKKESGDHRTPEGIYYFSKILEGDQLPSKYGIMAFVIDYPNFFDRLENRNGYGIWLHAADEPNRALFPNDTKGCVVVQNEDIIELSRYIKLNNTPVVIVQEASYAHSKTLSTIGKSLDQFVNDWKSAWENKDIDAYMTFYSKQFKSQKMNWQQWRRYKTNLNNNYKWIRVKVENLNIVWYNTQAIITFTQNYSSNSHSDIGKKYLYVHKEKEKLKIIGEEWRSQQTFLAQDENRGENTHGGR